MSMLAKMASRDYINYLDTNNIGIKYALTLSDEDLRTVLNELVVDQEISQVDLDTIRASMMAAKYPWVMEMTKKYFGFRE